MSPTESVISKVRDSTLQAAGWGETGKRVALVLYILLCVEIGTFLLVVPWSSVWGHNWLLSYFPVLRPLYISPYLRGAISGLGLINLWLGISQAWNFPRLSAHSPVGD